MKLHFTNDWLRRKIAADPDVDIEAGPAIVGDSGHIFAPQHPIGMPMATRATLAMNSVAVLVQFSSERSAGIHLK